MSFANSGRDNAQFIEHDHARPGLISLVGDNYGSLPTCLNKLQISFLEDPLRPLKY
jgi:hypothetical protein